MNKPIEKISEEMYNDYTMNGLIPVVYQYRDDSDQAVQDEIRLKFTKEEFDLCEKRIKRKEQNYYGFTDTWLYDAFEIYPLTGKSVLVVGSTHPWYETMCVVYGAEGVVVSEYCDRTSFHDKITYKKPHEFDGIEQFDVALSISSYEHDGLGRYGDPLNPNGDLLAMQQLKKVIKKDGTLFLSIPVGKDMICFNVHRIYGEHRFYRLINNWKPLATFGFMEDSFDIQPNGTWGTPYQPVIVLENI